ncbi:hypothetical protein QYE76_062276 [Lolium multiflorum]|uniref:Uncharacterized protein n=1 Tax=Lolium multiflorum TaxID=4521 RepID=A0AAD8S3U3_LOLMU|nr:hypothetical protein QYE76_062276 [Lolium multiflorum]
MERNGTTPEPTREGWDIRAQNWFLTHGCEYDMKTGNIVESDSRVRVPREEWIKVTTEIKAGKLKFAPDREKDLLTLVLGNPEKGGRTRGFGPSVPWSLGPTRRLIEAERELKNASWRCNDRMAEFQRQLDQQQREVQQQQREINELKGQRQPDNTAGISQRRDSSVADSEAPTTRMIDGGPGDPVDGIKEQTPCDLLVVFRNMSVKVAVGYVLPAFGPEDIVPTADIVPQFVYGADLVSKEQLHKLPTHMRNLHQWYLDACKENISFHWILLDIKVDKGIVEVRDPLSRGVDGFRDLQKLLQV